MKLNSGGITINTQTLPQNKSYGLDDKQVLSSRQKYGSNTLTVKKRKGFWRQFVSNLGDPVIKILLIALAINVIFMFRNADWFETGGIALSVFLATLISTMSEYGSEAAFLRLSEECAKIKCQVRRNGNVTQIDISDLVVGDIVILGAGEMIPADGMILSGHIYTDQSGLTGESREIEKRPKNDSDTDDTTPSSPYYCFRGCTVYSGNAEMEVINVGDNTALGGISAEVQTETRESPLRVRLTKLAKQISRLGYIAAFLVALVSLFNSFVLDSAFDKSIILYKLGSFEYVFSKLFSAFTLGLTVIVMAVPEGLPVMIAVVLSSNIKRMVKDNVLVRKPVGIEAAGSMNILFTDKTGTLTEGKSTVSSIVSGDGVIYSSLSQLKEKSPYIFNLYIENAYINTSSVKGVDQSNTPIPMSGNATERALLQSALDYTVSNCKVLFKNEFSSENKYSSAGYFKDNVYILLIKGAPDKLMPNVRYFLSRNGEVKPFDKSMFKKLCNTGKRQIMICKKENPSPAQRDITPDGILTLICMVTLEDKIRKEAKESVELLHRADIQVVMITGDSAVTAKEIAKQCSIIQNDDDLILESSDMSHMSDAKLKEILPRLRVVARALPNDKSRLVRISEELNLVVGMTGDGINDAPALKRADVGFSMGNGTQVAKDAGDIIIMDNNLSSIVKAVLYGRNIFKSIRKFISLQLTMNFCAVGISMICPFIGIDAPVTVVQMLWINIIMDTLGGLAFAGEVALPSYMDEKPKKRDEQILNGYMINEILLQGGFTIALCIAFLKIPEISSCFRWAPDSIYLLTAFFALFIFSSVFNCFNARTDRLNLLSGLSKNRTFIIIMLSVLAIQLVFIYVGGAVLRTAPLSLRELFITSVFALTVFPADIIRKLIWRLFAGKKGY